MIQVEDRTIDRPAPPRSTGGGVHRHQHPGRARARSAQHGAQSARGPRRGAAREPERRLFHVATNPQRDEGRHEAELGDVLFACVNVARRLNVDPELALRRASGRFVSRVELAEELAAREGRVFAELPLPEQDAYYDRAKGGERG